MVAGGYGCADGGVGRSWSLEVVVLPVGPVTCLLLAGELDGAGRGRFVEAVRTVLEDPVVERVSVDVALVDFCDSDGIGALLHAWRLARHTGTPLHLTGSRPSMRRLLRLADATSLLLPVA